MQSLTAAAEAIPYMEGVPFRTARDPIAGTVLASTMVTTQGKPETITLFEDVFRARRR